MGLTSFSPSPMTTTPSICTVARTFRIMSTAAWSAAFLSPCTSSDTSLCSDGQHSKKTPSGLLHQGIAVAMPSTKFDDEGVCKVKRL